jgi:hypothetical protein
VAQTRLDALTGPMARGARKRAQETQDSGQAYRQETGAGNSGLRPGLQAGNGRSRGANGENSGLMAKLQGKVFLATLNFLVAKLLAEPQHTWYNRKTTIF